MNEFKLKNKQIITNKLNLINIDKFIYLFN